MRVTLIAAARPAGAVRFGSDDAPADLARVQAAAPRFRNAARVDCAPSHTALATAAALGLAPAKAPLLADPDFGSWTGRTLDAVAASEPAALAAWVADPAVAPPDGESAVALMRRVGSWLDSLDAATIGIAHPSLVRAAVAHGLGAGPTLYARLDVGFLSETVLTRHGAAWRLKRLAAKL